MLRLFLQAVVPMIGYLMWVSCLLGYVTFVLELVVGAAFVGFSHIAADGDELVNQMQSYGYGTMLIALFYPVLMVLGMVFVNFMMYAMITSVNQTFLFGSESIGTLYDPIAIAVLLTVQAGLYYNVIIRSYRLISAIPEWPARSSASTASSRREFHGW